MTTPIAFSSPVHQVVFWLSYVGWFVPELVRGRTLRASAGRDDRGSYGVVVGGIWVAVALAFASAAIVPATSFVRDREVWFVTGIVLMIAGVAFRTYAIRTLGRAFTFEVATRSDQIVCERGPYRYIRHPAYAGTLVTLLGIGLALGNYGGALAAVLVGGAAHAYRIAVEERVLRRELGETYVAYASRTRRLIPFVF